LGPKGGVGPSSDIWEKYAIKIAITFHRFSSLLDAFDATGLRKIITKHKSCLTNPCFPFKSVVKIIDFYVISQPSGGQ